MDITFTKAETLKDHPEDSSLGFGTVFTDYMFNMDYSPEEGWHNPRIEPYGPIAMDPSSMVLHYGQAIFEGLKAYRTASGEVQLFRPEDNLSRLNKSGNMLCMPELDEAFIFKALKELINIEKDWVPSAPGTSLYIRPTIIATDPYIGLRSSHTYRVFIILSPVGAYYPEGFDPVKIWVTTEYVRAVRGGVGQAKTAGNYAASLYATNLANQEGYTQVMWLDGVELKYVEEVGSMNIFFAIGDELISAHCDLDMCDRYKKTLFDFDRYRRPEMYQLIASTTALSLEGASEQTPSSSPTVAGCLWQKRIPIVCRTRSSLRCGSRSESSTALTFRTVPSARPGCASMAVSP